MCGLCDENSLFHFCFLKPAQKLLEERKGGPWGSLELQGGLEKDFRGRGRGGDKVGLSERVEPSGIFQDKNREAFQGWETKCVTC